MSNEELKRNIIRLVNQEEDENRLRFAYRELLNLFETPQPESWEYNENLEESLRISLLQISAGKAIPHEVVMAKYREKFGR